MRILSIANAVKRKRLDLCVKACAQLDRAAAFNTLNWRIIGRGPLLDELKGLAPQSMEFLDRVESLGDHYRWTDIFVLPSADEGFGMVYIESIMCGRPIICRAGDGGQDIIDNTGGGLAIEIPEDDQQAVDNICSAIMELANDRGQYISEEIISKATRMVDPVRLRQQWEELIRSCGF